MIDHDRLFEELLKTFFVEFVELFLPEVYAYLEPDSVVFLDKEIFIDVTSGESYEVDLVAKARVRGQESFFLIHVEHQAQPQTEFGRRLFRYFARLFEEHGLPVYPVVIYDKPRRPEPSTFRIGFPDRVVLEFNYRVIQLNRLHWRDFLRHQNPVAAALMAKMQMKPEERKRVKLECLRLIATLKLDRARMHLISGFVDTYLKLNAAEEKWFKAELKKLDPTTQKEVMEIVTSWMEEGIKKGLQQGRQEGRQEGGADVILRLLTRRFGALSPRTQKKIRHLSIAQLEELSEALLDFSSLKDLTARLRENA